MLFSVVIPTFNRVHLVHEILDALAKQTDTDIEVVVAIDGSTDGTHELVDEYAKRATFAVRWVDTGLSDTYGLAIARNLGIHNAEGDAIALLDDDCVPVSEWVAEHKRTVTPGVLTGGWRSNDDKGDSLREKMEKYREVYGDSTPQPFQRFEGMKNPYVVENNTCMYRDDWLESGLFDESIQYYGGIGQEFIQRLMHQGYRYQFNPRAAVVQRTSARRKQQYPRPRKPLWKRMWRTCKHLFQ